MPVPSDSWKEKVVEQWKVEKEDKYGKFYVYEPHDTLIDHPYVERIEYYNELAENRNR